MDIRPEIETAFINDVDPYIQHGDSTRGDCLVSDSNPLVLGLTIAAVIIVPGLANGFLSSLGYPLVGSAVWALGYGVGVVYIWYTWIRPLDISAPEGVGGTDDEETTEN